MQDKKEEHEIKITMKKLKIMIITRAAITKRSKIVVTHNDQEVEMLEMKSMIKIKDSNRTNKGTREEDTTKTTENEIKFVKLFFPLITLNND